MLLLTAVTLGGQEALGALEHLMPDESELLKSRALALFQIPREQRVAMLVSEMKRLISSRKGLLWSVESTRLAEVLKRERPALVEVLLRALPSGVATSIRDHLPRKATDARREIRTEVLNVVRWKLDELLQTEAPKKVTFRFSDLRLLQGRELLTLTQQLGLKALSSALAGLDENIRMEFIAGLPPELRVPAAQFAEAAQPRKLLPEDAPELIALHQQGGNSPLDAVVSAGAQRVIRAAMAQSLEFASGLLERHRAELPASFMRWFKEERGRTFDRGDGGRAEIVIDLELLAEGGLVDPPLRISSKEPPKRPPSGEVRLSSKVARLDPEPTLGDEPSLKDLTRRDSPHRVRPVSTPPGPGRGPGSGTGRGGQGGSG